jgi:hypothetical protein
MLIVPPNPYMWHPLEVLSAVSPLRILAALIIAFVIGYIWYGPLFGKTWMKLVGLTEEKCRKNMKAMYWNVLITILLALQIEMYMIFLGGHTTFAGVFVGVRYAVVVALVLAMHALYEQRSAKLTLINIGFSFVCLGTMGAVIGYMS